MDPAEEHPMSHAPIPRPTSAPTVEPPFDGAPVDPSGEVGPEDLGARVVPTAWQAIEYAE